VSWREDGPRRPRKEIRADFGDHKHWLGVGVQHWLRNIPGSARRVWGRSLQLRVAATTLFVTGVFVFIIGIFLVNQISSGVLRAKREAATLQVEAGRENALNQLAAVSPGDLSGMKPVLQQLTASTENGGDSGLYYVSIRSSEPALTSYLGKQPAVPDALREEVQSGGLAFQYAQVTPPSAGGEVTALIVGAPVVAAAGSFELYYIFPLGSEQDTVALVQRTVWFAGLGLMLLIAAIALLVTRQVVRPVQVVAQTAQQISAGDLTKRVNVRGSDELALLGRSFNDMASSLQGQLRRLEDLSRLQRRFTSDVSHELRTPLTTVRMAAEILYARRDEFPADLNRSTELLHAELDRFEGLLGDLLEISRYDAGVARLELESIDVRSVVNTAVSASRALAQTQGSNIDVLAPNGPVLASVDARRIERILRNLLGNAIDHGEGRPIRVIVQRYESRIEISVRDYGVGLRPGEAGLVFNRFWRGDPSRSRLTGGTGLGLAISLEDARLHGGWLQAWGERGNGALFRLTIPVDADTPLPATPLPLAPDDTAVVRAAMAAPESGREPVAG
jgi:two-component system sensor histidine kinase MtrB